MGVRHPIRRRLRADDIPEAGTASYGDVRNSKSIVPRLTGRADRTHTAPVSRDEIDAYLAGVDEPKRAALEQLRRAILAVIPDAEECISYRIPAFRVDGAVVAGFAAFAKHLSYFPFSGSVLGRLGDEIAGYAGTKSALHFPVDEPLPEGLVRRLIEVRLQEVRSR
jgi:uncharacterized protein YdhG (YjbR/CyaY superfamily)